MNEMTNRQEDLLAALGQSIHPVSGQALAKQLGVTRQVVVHDIALLRAMGHRILATPKGYLIQSTQSVQTALVAVSHKPEQTPTELNIFVDCGLRVIDVRVEHRVYGEIVANLYLSSRRDVEHFLAKIQSERAPFLSSLTGGIHYHLVEFDHADQLTDAIAQLRSAGIVVID
ncbi:transcription repressor NadR [Alicyclobacillus fastidiosus]|uniref:Transcription repressor NadR n=1 Tax=Alicyclobacillus fastidiosus TaxID=392011 RepID=A0ABY6ZI13_9BACL|nr:transcription repressor NadR [Alicyclobacillus fastidiosus]WAH41555.1 transcription repressor NadR [Alicyclobacillus fastidiosus]